MKGINFGAANGPQRKALRGAITAAFKKRDFERFLDEDLNLNFEALVSEDSFETMAWELILRFARNGTLDRFMDAWIASAEFGSAPALADLLQSWSLFAPQDTGADVGGQHSEPVVDDIVPPAGSAPITMPGTIVDGGNDALESILERGVARSPGTTWLGAMATLSRQVCMIRSGQGSPIGTGFLVGPRHILTTAHIVDIGRRVGEQLEAMFDHGSAEGLEPTIVGVDKILLSDPDVSQQRSDWFETLDFAVLTSDALAREVKRNKRGWIDLADFRSRLRPGEPVMALHHPGGGGLTVSTGAISNPPALAGRFGHDANTSPGASGAPLFDGNLRLIGLHEAGIPEEGGGAKLNYAIRADAIARQIEERGFNLS